MAAMTGRQLFRHCLEGQWAEVRGQCGAVMDSRSPHGRLGPMGKLAMLLTGTLGVAPADPTNSAVGKTHCDPTERSRLRAGMPLHGDMWSAVVE